MLATSFKRFFTFLIDFIIIIIITSLLAPLAYLIIGVPNFASEFNTVIENVQVAFYNAMTYGTEEYYNAFSSAAQTYLRYEFVSIIINIVLNLIIMPIYFIIIPMFAKGQTIGRLAMGTLVVINNETNDKPKLKHLILREFVGTFILYGIFGTIVMIVSAFISIYKGRSLVDIISGTKLIDKRAIPYPKDPRTMDEILKSIQEDEARTNKDYMDAEVKEYTNNDNNENEDDNVQDKNTLYDDSYSEDNTNTNNDDDYTII